MPKKQVVLLGDAAHAMWPSLGQGANVALESAVCLGKICEEFGIKEALQNFDELRRPQTDACGRLSMAGFSGASQRTATSFMFILRISLLVLANKLLPKFFPLPAIFELGNPEYSYDQIEKRIKVEVLKVASFFVFIVALVAKILLFRNVS